MTVDCPKEMTSGPCGGVAADGTCELGDRRCSFVDLPTVRWEEVPPPAVPELPAAAAMRALLTSRPVLVADLSAPAMDAPALRSLGATLAGAVDAVLVGDGPQERVQFPPVHRAAILRSAGATVWSGLNCRDRNRVALEGELAALGDLGVGAVLSVTGDHPASGHRPDAKAVFDLDSTELAALAAAAGLLVAVGESPAAPPVRRRAERLAQKAAAGAEVCFVDHCGGEEPVTAFVREARDLGLALRFLACVPLIVDADSARMIASFPGLVVPPGLLDRVARASDARAAGIAAAADLALRLLDAGLDGIDLSGGAGPDGDHAAYADAVAEVAARLALT